MCEQTLFVTTMSWRLGCWGGFSFCEKKVKKKKDSLLKGQKDEKNTIGHSYVRHLRERDFIVI